MASFDFTPVDTFFEDMNRADCFDTKDMDGKTPNYKVIICSECAKEFKDCIDQDGTLKEWNDEDKTGVTIVETFGEDDGTVPLLYSKGINMECTISIISNGLYYDLGDYDTPIKALFLVSYGNGSGYVLAYCINDEALVIHDDEVIFNIADVILSLKYVGG